MRNCNFHLNRFACLTIVPVMSAPRLSKLFLPAETTRQKLIAKAVYAGAATGIGALIGMIAGGGKGAAIGAAIGGSAGAGGVLSTRGKDIRLDRGTQLKLRTSTDARIQ